MSTISARSMNSIRIRQAILDGARKVFLNEGYTASIDKIAKESGVARKTIFNMFQSKDNLFEVVLSESIVHAVDVRALDDDGEIEAVLGRFAREYAKIALSDEVILLTRLVNAEYLRFPDLISRLSRSFLFQMIPSLSAYFKRQIDAGRIISVDPDMAAERFVASVLGYERLRRAFGGAPKSRAQLRKYIDEAVYGFVNGIRAPADRDIQD